jgi:hypothetical protein
MESIMRKDYLVAGSLMLVSWLAVWSMTWILQVNGLISEAISQILFPLSMLLVAIICLALGAFLEYSD